jgi:GntR family transcriptional regulator, transcriptional repressor for pyruvate dehydrogenase complex
MATVVTETDRMERDFDFANELGDDVKLPKLSHLVASKLRDQIVSGKLRPGSLLMPETKLLEVFKVSRPTLREALRILEADGLISIGRGMRKGAKVLGPSIKKAIEFTSFMLISEGVTMHDLHEARMFFEPAIVRSLSGSTLKKAVKDLRGCVAEMDSALKDKRYLDVVVGTNRFHELLVRASGNKTMTLIISMIQSISDDAYAVVINSNSTDASALDRNMAKTTQGYTALCDLLEKGKLQEAEKFWRTYMARSQNFLKRSKIGERRLVQKGGNVSSVAANEPA